MQRKIDTTHQENPKPERKLWQQRIAQQALGKSGMKAPTLEGTGVAMCTECGIVKSAELFPRQSGLECKACRKKQKQPKPRAKTLAELKE